jgi:hypothetical protein
MNGHCILKHSTFSRCPQHFSVDQASIESILFEFFESHLRDFLRRIAHRQRSKLLQITDADEFMVRVQNVSQRNVVAGVGFQVGYGDNWTL